MKIKLDAQEQTIEDQAETYQPVSEERLRQIETTIQNAQKSKDIHIRIAESDLVLLKEQALRDGISYQTLITSVLHCYIHGYLVDESGSKKVIERMHEKV